MDRLCGAVTSGSVRKVANKFPYVYLKFGFKNAFFVVFWSLCVNLFLRFFLLWFIFVRSLLMPVFIHCSRLMSRNVDLLTYLLTYSWLESPRSRSDQQRSHKEPDKQQRSNRVSDVYARLLLLCCDSKSTRHIETCIRSGKRNIFLLWYWITFKRHSNLTQAVSSWTQHAKYQSHKSFGSKVILWT